MLCRLPYMQVMWRSCHAHGVEVNTQGGPHGNALNAALHGGHLEIARVLVERGADVNAILYSPPLLLAPYRLCDCCLIEAQM